MFELAPHTRLRPSPYFEATVAAGVTGFMTYNQMLMPTGYGDPDGEYRRLLNGVAQWDVACQRQVQLTGPDAGRLAQILACRDLTSCADGQGKYVALCNHAGTIINDPILLKLDDDRYWLSIADSNILFWSRAIAAERGLDVAIIEPDVSPLAVQGPKAEDVIAAIFGDWVRDLKYFWFRETVVDGIPLMLARSGWSKQQGFELYLMDGAKGTGLWNIVREAGRPWGIGPGNPNPNERIESGLFSCCGDSDDTTNPFEVRLEKYVDLDIPDDVIGIEALRRIHWEGPVRHQLGVILDGDKPTSPHAVWYDILADAAKVGDMTNGVWSRRLERNIGFALISRDCAPGDQVKVRKDGKLVSAVLAELPFL
ncbi:MAG: glycine cleavage T C-terminal barrel domain-containing protein [Pseudomonadota bacterium]|nr:glycine cleavage T C-terminal barrel domain-containing protein [Pseudomonadota bacterium]